LKKSLIEGSIAIKNDNGKLDDINRYSTYMYYAGLYCKLDFLMKWLIKTSCTCLRKSTI